jgi:hypothetical protein
MRWRDHGDPTWERPRRREYWCNAQGYAFTWRKGHPNAAINGAIAVHRLAMSERLGRALSKGENVHHKNGKRADNGPTNLEVWLTQQPAGQRVWDMYQWCIDFIARYQNEIHLHRPSAEA